MCRPGWARARTAAWRLERFARMRRVRDRIDREYARPLDVEALARAADLPPRELTRQFRLAYGTSPYAYLGARRAERATVLLHRTDVPAAELHRLVGAPTRGVHDRWVRARSAV
ncbi:helix-turn-helix domain-containing protein [Streptomyces xanthii]|uniref:Helix-turn-helix transcriptional regulator n=1 Tax=Streptomyces xanthii TaxID=2768069 RepID=A0A7H1BGV2_9ACTN|nr:AraC family transcriptional regulator [Streptomyces xanthii]QNS07957.1 helix-turn-helix transcriptional regulator [Streptomyces xanthii]